MEVDAVFRVKVKPNAKRARIRVRELDIFLDTPAQPREGEANLEVIREMKKLFKREVVIIKGHKSREKVILVRNLMPEDAKKILDKCERFQEPSSE